MANPESDLILNVDDTDAARYAKTRILARAGFQIIEAETGTDALEMAVSQKPALVLLDVKLPDINGFDVCRRLKENKATQNILVLQTSASYIDISDKIRALEGGADNYLFEPIEPEELVANVRALLRLSKVERELRDMDRRKNEFLATLAHELRNPLGPIRTSVELLRALEPNASEIQETARETILRQTDHMVRLIDDLLDAARISQGKITLRQEQVRLKSVIQTAIESARPIIDRYGHQLIVELPEQDGVLTGDGVRLAQVVSNLLTNAAKFTPHGGKVTVTASQDNAEYVIQVRDNGIGLAPEHARGIFELFHQARHLPDRAREGLGIGLALVKSLVEMHDGRIAVTSAGAEGGSVFEVRLPATGMTSVLKTIKEGPATAVEPRRVLIVDDNRDAADMLASLFETQGHQVRMVYDGTSAMDAAKKFDPEVVILDLGLPDISGFDLAKALRGIPPLSKALILAASGYGQEVDKQRALEVGFDDHFTKPVSYDALSRVIERRFRQPCQLWSER